MAKHRTEIIILDDVSAIFYDKKAVQYLLAALGRMNGTALPLSYKRQGQEVRFEFTGGIICISNLAVENKGMLSAFKSRVHTLQHSPSDLMLIALCRHRICSKGWPVAKPELTVVECNEVIEWVLKESCRLKVPVDLRVILEKAMPDFLAWRRGTTEAHWHDLVTTTLEEEVTTLVFSTALQDRCLMVQCVRCGLVGTVQNPTEAEWATAFYAPSQPYRWTEEGRVKVESVAPFCVVPRQPGVLCGCIQNGFVLEPENYERVPGGIGVSDRVLTDEERRGLLSLVLRHSLILG